MRIQVWAVACCVFAASSVRADEVPTGAAIQQISNSSVVVLIQGGGDGATAVAAWEDPTPYLGSINSFSPYDGHVELLGPDESVIYSVPANFDGARPGVDEEEILEFVRFHADYSLILRLPRIDSVRSARLFFGPDRYPEPNDGRTPVSIGLSPELLDYLTSQSRDLEQDFEWVQRTRLMLSGRSETRRDIVFVGDGFTVEMQDEFVWLAEMMMADLLGHEPFSSYSYTLNFRTAMRPSFEAGISREELRRETAYNSVYRQNNGAVLYADAAYPETQEDERRMFDDAASAGDGSPDMIVLITYDPEWYAVRNSFAVVVSAGAILDRVNGPQILVRLLASAAKLGTESPGDRGTRGIWMGEPTSPNLTMACDAELGELPRPSKWQRWFGYGVWEKCVAQNEGGGGYRYNVWHSGGNSCIMGNLSSHEYCPVCRETMTKEIAASASILGDVLPLEDHIQSADGSFSFSVERADPRVTLFWSVDGSLVLSGTADDPGVRELLLDAEPGASHEVRLEYAVGSEFLRELLLGSRTWTVEVP